MALKHNVEPGYREGLVIGLVIFTSLAANIWIIFLKKNAYLKKVNYEWNWFKPLRQLVNTDHIVQHWILTACFVCQSAENIIILYSTSIIITNIITTISIVFDVHKNWWGPPQSKSHPCIVVRS